MISAFPFGSITIKCVYRSLVRVSVWIWPKTLRSVTGRKSLIVVELIIGFLRTDSSNRQWRWLATATNKTILHSILALMITQTISTTTMVIITYCSTPTFYVTHTHVIYKELCVYTYVH